MSTESEHKLENNFIAHLTEVGYQLVYVRNEHTLKDNLRAEIARLNKDQLADEPLDDDEWSVFLGKICRGNNAVDRARILRDEVVIRREGRKTLSLKLVDTENWANNSFQVTNQYEAKFKDANHRYDVTILINGIPITQIELKRRGKELKEAFNQIQRYDRDSFYQYGGNLYQFLQLFIISNGVNTEYFANNKILNKLFSFAWTDEENNKISELFDFTETFLTPEHLHRMIFEYSVITTADTVMTLRPYQYYAVEAVLETVERGSGNGYIWHTTGSGKTLTSFKVSQILSGRADIKKVVFVVDRKDLDTQTMREFNSFADDSFTDTTNTSTLVEKLNSEDTKLVVTTIQKLNRAVASLDRQISHLRNEKVIFIFDECHRSQFGTTHKRITEFFTNTQLFGFTGTPIFAENSSSNEHGKRTTADLFDKCLHKYLIADAINDSNVLPFKVDYVGRYKDKTNSSTYVDMEVQGIDIAELMNSKERMQKVTDFVLDHHGIYTLKHLPNHSNKNYTAVFACSSIDNLCQYYEMFRDSEVRKSLGFKLAAVFSYGVNDDFEEDNEGNVRQNSDRLNDYVGDYNKQFKTSFDLNKQFGFDLYNRDVSQRVKKGQVDILFVVNMYLTGFDSKLLNTLYVDKNLRQHGLIQAFSRTNRVYSKEKEYGNIVCFRNIKPQVDEAVALFSNNTPNERVFAPDYQVLLDEFNKALESLRSLTPTVQSVDMLMGNAKRTEFVKTFRKILRQHNVLKTCTDFDYDHTTITEQELADYSSKYLDLRPSVNQYTEQKLRDSIVEDIDFEIELIPSELIDVDYILHLLDRLVDPEEVDTEKIKEKLLRELANNVKYHSKKKLIEKFIDEQLVNLDNPMSIKDRLGMFIDNEREKALHEISSQYGVSPDQLGNIIEDRVWRHLDIINEDLSPLLLDKYKFRERKQIVNQLSNSVNEYAELYYKGW